MEKRLSELKSGDSAIIRRFEPENTLYIKLLEMGCVPGETISVEHVAPLGDPISIHVAGYSLSLRINEAELIWVEPAFTSFSNR